MVRDGIYYAAGMAAAAALVGWLAAWPFAVLPLALGAFFLWFFRDPDRAAPSDPDAIVSPADGKVTDVSSVVVGGAQRTRLSIFMNVFDVHVNRSPVRGVVSAVEYRRGRFQNAMAADCADCNEQNIVTVEGEGHTVIFKQIAGLLARRIVFTPKVGDRVERGQRVGMIKFSSRVDVVLGAEAEVSVKAGDRVKAGASTLGRFVRAASSEPKRDAASIPAEQIAGAR
jgi:phosphatidylserine decarboxylase